jgi:hypothetical protein
MAEILPLLMSRKTPHDCRYKGFDGMNRWVGLGIIADNVVTSAAR